MSEILRFTNAEEEILKLLVSDPRPDHEALEQALLRSPFTRADSHGTSATLRQTLSKLRAKLRCHGMDVHNLRGRGYYMEPADREKIVAMVREGKTSPIPQIGGSE